MRKILFNILKYIIKQLAKLIIWRYKPEIIAITGSVGKTSAKEAIYSVLANVGNLSSADKKGLRVRKSKGNLNNEFGVPLTIIGDWKENELNLVSRATPPEKYKLRKLLFWSKVILSALIRVVYPRKLALVRRSASEGGYPKVLILEYGADRPGDIKYLLKIGRPKIGVITAIGDTPVHVEFYESPAEVAKEKGKLIESLQTGGFAVLNFNDVYAMNMKEKTRANILTFGFNDGADIKISNFENYLQARIDADKTQINADTICVNPSNNLRESALEGVSFKIEYGGSFVPINLKNVFSRTQAYAVAAAFCVGIIYGLNLVEIAELIERYYIPPKRRMNLIKGIKESWVIDDSYNASPLSVKEALAVLKDLNIGRKIVLLGDMLELGKYSIEAHENAGKIVGEVADVLITVGPRAQFIADKARQSGMPPENIFSFHTADEALPEIKKIIKKGDLILVKASRAIGLDKIVDEIKEM